MYAAEARNPENPNFIAQEILTLVADNQLDLATKKLMDFATNFGRYKNRRGEALDIRRSFNEWRERQRRFEVSSSDLSRLVHRITDLIDQILDEYTESMGGGARILPSTKGSNKVEELLVTSVSDLAFSVQSLNSPSTKKQEIPADEYKSKDRDRWGQKKNQFKKRTEDFSGSTSALDYSNLVFIGRHIKQAYKTQSINFSLSLSELCLKYGEITSLIGENGNGKTTLLKIIAGELKETEGDLKYPALSKEKSKIKDYYGIKQQIAYIPQELPRWSGLLVDNLHFSAAIHGIKGDQNEFEVDYVISRLGLDTHRNSTWDEISGGFKMRFALARALVWNPKILILDEPLANLDINTQMTFLEDLRDIADSIENRKSIILSSQHLHEVETITDNVIFLKKGSVLYNGDLREFGEDRTENSFEISCDLSKGELMALLESVNYTQISTALHNHYIIDTSRTVSGNELLKVFSEQNVEIFYFRDISKSTRRLFNLD